MDLQSIRQGRTGDTYSRYVRWSIMSIFALIFLWNLKDLVAYNKSGQIMVKQAWWTGTMSVKSNNGFLAQMLGDITRLDRQLSVTFTNDEKVKGLTTHAFWVRYNDGGTAWWGGTARFNIPSDDDIFKLLRAFESEEVIINELLVPGMREICTSTAGLISTEESYTTKRTMISEMCSDQANKGVYLVDIAYSELEDEFGKKQRVPVYNIKEDANGNYVRKPAVFSLFGISSELFLVPDIDFPDNINRQIKDKMQFRTQLQVTDADIEKFEQELNEVAATGLKDVKVEEMKQEKIREKKVQLAEAYRATELLAVRADSIQTVNKLAETKAEVESAILEAKGEAARRKKQMAGDDALEIRRNVYEEAITFWTEAIMARAENAPDMATNWDPNYFFNLLNTIDEQLRSDLNLNLTFKTTN